VDNDQIGSSGLCTGDDIHIDLVLSSVHHVDTRDNTTLQHIATPSWRYFTP